MDISIVICTYNRAAMLRDSLESYLRMQRPPAARSEVLIVDNNSNDETAAVGKEFCERSPGTFRYIQERTQGLSYARNTGILASRGDLIAFVDDDIFFDAAWLVEMLRLFRETDAMCAGGRSIPVFEGGTPAWMSAQLLTLYGSTNSGAEVKRMVFPEHPYGLNMVIRRKVFEAVGPFNVTLGRIRNSLLSNEEVELFQRIDRGKLPVFYTPFAIVHHRIPAARARKAWILRRYYYQGISDIAFRRTARRADRGELLHQVAGNLLWIMRLATAGVCAWVTGRSGGSAGFERVTLMYYAAGRATRALRDIMRPLPAHEGTG